MQHRHVEALDRGKRLDVLVDEVGKAPQDRGATGRAERRPSVCSADGCGHGVAGNLGVAPRYVAQLERPVKGGAILEGVGRPHSLAVDVVVESDGHAANVGSPSRRHDSNLGRTLG